MTNATAVKTQTVSVNSLREGDVFAGGTMIIARYRDGDGIWIETDDGEVGYAMAARYRIQARQ
jgi:hypothetical protein